MTTRRDFHKVAGAAAVASRSRACRRPRPERAHKWKMQSLWQAGSVNQKIFDDWTKKVKEITGGRIEIEPLPVGSIVAYTETLGAMRDGVLDAHHSGAPYASGLEPGLALLGDLNGGFENPYQMQMWFEYGGGIELAREIYKRFNTFYVGPVWWGVESVPAKKPLRTLADFKGVKMRVPEGLGAEIWRRAGVGVVTLARQRSLYRARSRCHRGDRLGHARDEQRSRLPQDREVSALPGFPFDAVRGSGGQHDQVERTVARSQGAHGSGCARLRARYGPAHCPGGYKAAEQAKAAGFEIGQLDCPKSAASSASFRENPGPTGRRRARPPRGSTTARSPS